MLKRPNPEAALQVLVAFAKRQGLRLKAPIWSGFSASYALTCSNGHEFSRSGQQVLGGHCICQQCRADTLKQSFLASLASQGLRCRDGTFLGLAKQHQFTCDKGHSWFALARKVMQGTGCPHCLRARRANRRLMPDGLKHLHELAVAHHGRCLATTYYGMAVRYQWECAQGHRWQAMASKVAEGAWCPRCAREHVSEPQHDPDGLARLQQLAQARGGECLDGTYSVSQARYRFRCHKGHEWSASGHLVLNGIWCKRCAPTGRRRTIEQMQEAARERGGRCLSTEYLGIHAKLTWECANGHVWQTTPATVTQRGCWCPSCYRLQITRDPIKRMRYEAK